MTSEQDWYTRVEPTDFPSGPPPPPTFESTLALAPAIKRHTAKVGEWCFAEAHLARADWVRRSVANGGIRIIGL